VSVSPGTGAQFSILPPQNATGNWVKVVQRVPVRIAFDALLDMIVTQQAAMLAYINDFKLLMILTLATIPLVLIIGRARQAPGGKGEAVAID
jgi:multidrug resistance efflux pump